MLRYITQGVILSFLSIFPLLPVLLTEHSIYIRNKRLNILREQYKKELDDITLNIMKKYR
jgi:hypothetical protein